ncbi:dephospho-CoA kinase [Nesterenkonia alkaliphila]|uniref:dephospho-CoA kinase n=1 Tax=Nesterenkonia alkaliphila TaxID=1463631 RepID=UPI0012FC33D7|nr:dephospho-CoA kinase [Nesterenkonia alkaliphila]GGA00357.1 dephospho-CoA kinase [Nesterenkonia alkaliphila]
MAEILSVGLTGGIASGKSAVSQRLAEHGAVLIDADQLARQVVAPGSEGLAQVVEEFGEQVLAAEGGLDRKALSKTVFDNDDARARLNAIIHPRVRAASAEIREAAPEGSVVVEDIPLLVETGQQDRFDVVVVVQAPREERLRRLQENRGMGRAEAERIFAAQATDAQRAEAADVLLDNSGSLDDLTAQVDALWQDLSSRLQ